MWLIPSRGRPGNLNRLLAAMDARGTSARRVVRIDDDDEALTSYRNICARWGAEIVLGPRIGCGASYNDIWHRYHDQPWYGCIQDDVVPETDGWEAKLVQAVNGGIAYPDDCIHGANLATNPVIDGELAKRIGWLAVPDCSHWFIDNAWMVIGQEFDCLHYVPEVKLKHYHHLFGGAQNDATYAASQNRAAADGMAFHAWLRDGFPALRERMRVDA